MMLPESSLLLFSVAIVAGSLNAVAGGGTFLTFPTLIFTGVLPINANATSTVALWPGLWASAAAYRRELARHRRPLVVFLAATSAAGGLLGAILLLRTPQATFLALAPYLLLTATLIFAAGRRAADLVDRLVPGSRASTRAPIVAASIVQFAVAVYGGYFGAGIGILMLATLTFMGLDDVHEMNAVRMLFSMSINGVAVLVFVASGIVEWPQALLMLVGAVLGGYVGAAVARRIEPRWIRGFVILVGVGMAVSFFCRGES